MSKSTDFDIPFDQVAFPVVILSGEAFKMIHGLFSKSFFNERGMRDFQVIKKLWGGGNAGYKQIISCAGAGDVE